MKTVKANKLLLLKFTSVLKEDRRHFCFVHNLDWVFFKLGVCQKYQRMICNGLH